MSHLKNVHKETWEGDYRKSKSKGQTTISFPKVDTKTEKSFRWMEWVIPENREPICQKTLQKYIDLVTVRLSWAVKHWLVQTGN